MQNWLNKWINQYVEPNPGTASEEDKARKPLAAAEVTVEEVEGNPGYYTSKFFLRPHYQLEGLTVSLRLVSKLPSQKTWGDWWKSPKPVSRRSGRLAGSVTGPERTEWCAELIWPNSIRRIPLMAVDILDLFPLITLWYL